jgi:hypothetical protein
MSKSINLVYERFNNTKQPLSNNYNLSFDIKTNVEPHFYHRLPLVKFHSADNLPESYFLYELNWDYNKTQVDFFDTVLAPGNIRESILTRIREKTAFVMLTVLHESWLDDQFLSLIYDKFSQANIPLCQLIYVSNCFNGVQLYENYCARHNIPMEVKIEYCPTHRIDKVDVENIYKKRKYNPGNREKTFLCFNRRFSDHRLLFYMLVEKENLLDQFYLSMSKDQPESTNTFLNKATQLTGYYSMFQISLTDVVRADSKLPLILDNPNFNNYPMERRSTDIQKYYDKSLINIITETYFFNNIIHITEKTYKPIAFMQPFIMIAAPFSLKHIKDMGFKTFSKFWDESYDEEVNHVERMNKIFNVIKFISEWSESEKIEFSHQVADILKYNSLRLQSIKNIEMMQFVEKYGF